MEMQRTASILERTVEHREERYPSPTQHHFNEDRWAAGGGPIDNMHTGKPLYNLLLLCSEPDLNYELVPDTVNLKKRW